MPLAAGTHLGPYEIVSFLGAGGMGEVYRARDPRLGRDVAAKLISGDEPSAERLRRFERGAYLVFELLEGETLRERLVRGPLPVRKAIELAIQAAHGLAAAHAHGILHRDLKPGNVFVGLEGADRSSWPGEAAGRARSTASIPSRRRSSSGSRRRRRTPPGSSDARSSWPPPMGTATSTPPFGR